MQNITIKNLDSILHFQTETLNKTLLKLSSLKDSLSSFQLASSVQINKLESEQNKKVSNISKEQLQLSNNINTVKQESSNYFISLNETISSNSILTVLFIIGSFLCAIILFFTMRKRINSDSTRFNEQQMRLDQKLVELYDSQLSHQKEALKTAEKSESEIDHSLALKVGDEIVRMRKNISHMPHETIGLKQLNKALQRIQDTFKLNGYEMIEMLNQPYNEGMKVVANFVPDDKLENGQQLITGIIKPQINFNGIMIQSAQIKVSVGE